MKSYINYEDVISEKVKSKINRDETLLHEMIVAVVGEVTKKP